MVTTVAQLIMRKGSLADMPMLASGEQYLAENEQRLFLGQVPVTGTVDNSASDATTAYVSFTVEQAGTVTELDLDDVNEYSIVVTDGVTLAKNTISNNSITTDDTVFTFNHGLSRVIAGTDTFELVYNKEITSYQGERNTRRQSVSFTKSANNSTPQSTTIDFLSSIKNDITIEYTLFNTTHMRKGTLTISLLGATTSHIADVYSGSDELSTVDFTISNPSTGKFQLDFDTSILTQLHFNYTQTSSKFVTS